MPANWLVSHQLVLILLVGCLTSPQSSVSKNLIVTNAEISKHISPPSITAIHKDRHSRLWIGTQEGLYLFAGGNPRFYNHVKNSRDSIPSSHITGIVENDSGEIYVTTFEGEILRWQPIAKQFEVFYEGDLVDRIRQIEISESGKLWLLTGSGIRSLNPEEDPKNMWTQPALIPAKHGRPLVLRPMANGNLLVGTTKGLFKLIEGHMQTKEVVLGNTLHGGVSAISKRINDEYVVGTTLGALIFVKHQGLSESTRSSLSKSGPVRVSQIVSFGESILVATDSGLYTATGASITPTHFEYVALRTSHSDITVLYPDNDRVWVGTYSGLNLMSETPFHFYDSTTSNLHSDVLAFAEESLSMLWIGTYDGLFLKNRISKKHTKFIPSSGQLLDQRITSVAFSNGLIWVGFHSGGVQAIDTSTNVVFTPDIKNMAEMNVTKLLANGSGKVWMATYNHGLYLIDQESSKSYLSNGSFEENSITGIYKTQSDELVATSFNNVYRYDQETDSFYILDLALPDGTEPPSIFVLEETSSGEFLAGTNSGLFYFELPEKSNRRTVIDKFSNSSILENAPIYGLEIDQKENIWCSTHNGIYVVNEDGDVLKGFGPSDGLQGDDFNLGAHFEDSSGNIYFGGANGYNHFYPERINLAPHSTPTILKSVLLRGADLHEIAFTDSSYSELVVAHSELPIVFHFNSLDFIDPSKIRYRYRLDGMHKEWRDVGAKDFASFSNLPPGKYSFSVQAANSSGIWSTETAGIEMRILPSPWRTWWAFCLYALSGIPLIWALHRIYYSFAIARKANELAFEMHLAEERADDEMQEQVELQQDLVQSAYDHNKTTLALIAGFLEGSDSKQSAAERIRAARKHQTRITALSNLEECLYFQAGGSVVDLYKLTEMLFTQLLPLAQVEPATLITINEVTKQLVPARIASPVAVIMCELVENSIEHAFSPSSPANYIHVSFLRSPQGDEKGDYWTLTVSDNGCGIEAFESKLERSVAGLGIANQLAQQLGGSVNYSYREGALITIHIPATPAHLAS